ncbi:MAG: glutamate-5-semialdehyde dehydrogenase [Muribaculaceae bacterium]|nr:glutamate-5-semialdehyde dehydrogenase [Muribaculaceae bacterium]
MDYNKIFENAKEASRKLSLTSDSQRESAILTLAQLVDESHNFLLEANRRDLDKMDINNPLYDRLQLTDSRLDAISSDLRAVAALPSPIGEVLEHRVLPNGIDLKKVRVPFGVVGIVYEARPNVTFDVFALCIKCANVALLKGGSDAENSNEAAISLIKKALEINNLPIDSCILMPSSRESTTALLNAVGYVDICIPRGGRRLIDFVRNTAKIPVIETGAGVVHTYFDRDGNLEIGRKVVENGKTRRVSVCNALDSLLVHKDRLKDLCSLLLPLSSKGVEIFADDRSFDILSKDYPEELLHKATNEDRDKEWMDLKMGVYTMDSVEDAIRHIALHGSGHSESIITEKEDTAKKFLNQVDASCVYVNLPTSFTDGGQFGLGAEIGISTQKLGPRGPMGLNEITTYKYILTGEGQTRP